MIFDLPPREFSRLPPHLDRGRPLRRLLTNLVVECALGRPWSKNPLPRRVRAVGAHSSDSAQDSTDSAYRSSVAGDIRLPMWPGGLPDRPADSCDAPSIGPGGEAENGKGARLIAPALVSTLVPTRLIARVRAFRPPHGRLTKWEILRSTIGRAAL